MESLFSSMIFLLLLCFSCFTSSEALTSNKGNITIKWDLMSWTPDGYVALVTVYNYQKQRSIGSPGWKMSWRWTRKEVIWSMVGAQTTEQGDCSLFNENIPYSCASKPTVIDLLPDTPYSQQIANCCNGGVLEPGYESAFQIEVGNAGTSVETVMMPENFTFMAPQQQYICGASKNVTPTRFTTDVNLRKPFAFITMNTTCRFHMAT